MSGDKWHDHVDATLHPRGVTHGMSHVVHLCEWLTLSHVSNGKIKKIKNYNLKKKKGVEQIGESGWKKNQKKRREKRKELKKSQKGGKWPFLAKTCSE